ncbi:uncharacterized protein N7469_006949 [Penicillium citrinum]|uniref:Uncharacterized protein n=1 Tax=Penicillium citrinum TaxID=5077 RepID=A0A9W9NXS5_PENCI|nr:uncharacterized protein N7469_006949 [Penicillium citrinum]KAJ5226943.1 hypothetical protein N7469_006949 [Penicillium citrinum]
MDFSHDIMTLPVWSEASTAEQHDLNRHTKYGFLTIVTYPLNLLTPTTVLDVEAISTSILVHQGNPRTVDERDAQTRDQHGDKKQDKVANSSSSETGLPKTEKREQVYQEDQIQSKVRFWDGKVPTSIAAASPGPSATRDETVTVAKSTKSEWTPGKGSIAAMVIMSLIVCGSLVYLVYWYVARECKGRRRHRLKETENLFDESSLSLGLETSRTLDEFLMKDVEPERTSIMFSRSRSPSITYVVDGAEAGHRSSKASRNSYDASLNSLVKMDPLARVSTDETRPSFIVSELTDSSKDSSTQPPSNVTPHVSPHTSPRQSFTSSKVAPTSRSSQLWETTTAATVTTGDGAGSIFSKDRTSHSSLASSHTSNMLPSSASSVARSRKAGSLPRSSSRYSSQAPTHSIPRVIDDSGESRRNHEKKHSSHSRSSMTISPIAESTGVSAQPQDFLFGPSSPPSLFRLSDAS